MARMRRTGKVSQAEIVTPVSSRSRMTISRKEIMTKYLSGETIDFVTSRVLSILSSLRSGYAPAVILTPTAEHVLEEVIKMSRVLPREWSDNQKAEKRLLLSVCANKIEELTAIGNAIPPDMRDKFKVVSRLKISGNITTTNSHTLRAYTLRMPVEWDIVLRMDTGTLTRDIMLVKHSETSTKEKAIAHRVSYDDAGTAVSEAPSVSPFSGLLGLQTRQEVSGNSYSAGLYSESNSGKMRNVLRDVLLDSFVTTLSDSSEIPKILDSTATPIAVVVADLLCLEHYSEVVPATKIDGAAIPSTSSLHQLTSSMTHNLARLLANGFSTKTVGIQDVLNCKPENLHSRLLEAMDLFKGLEFQYASDAISSIRYAICASLQKPVNNVQKNVEADIHAWVSAINCTIDRDDIRSLVVEQHSAPYGEVKVSNVILTITDTRGRLPEMFRAIQSRMQGSHRPISVNMDLRFDAEESEARKMNKYLDYYGGSVKDFLIKKVTEGTEIQKVRYVCDTLASAFSAVKGRKYAPRNINLVNAGTARVAQSDALSGRTTGFKIMYQLSVSLELVIDEGDLS